MPTKMNTDTSSAVQNEKGASDAANRPEPGSSEEKTKAETGKVAMQDFHFVAKVNKSTPDIS